MIFETFAERKKKAACRGEPEVYTYDAVSPQLRHQICAAIYEGIGYYHSYAGYELSEPLNANTLWDAVERLCHKEIFSYLPFRQEPDISQRFLNFLTRIESTEDYLSALEIACIILGLADQEKRKEARGAKLTGEQAIVEINGRFEQHAVGFVFENQRVIEKHTKFLHQEVVKPALVLLSDVRFKAANDEFLLAHQHFRSKSYKDCVNSANRSFESMLKTICDLRGWSYDVGAPSSKLILRMTENGVFSHRFEKSFDTFIAMLKSGLPTIRNNAGGHGDGVDPIIVSAHIARLALDMSAANLVFLAEAFKSYERCSGRR